MKWFKVYHDLIIDPKITLIARKSGANKRDVIAVWIYLLTCASENENRGDINNLDIELASVAIEMEEEMFTAIIEAMKAKNMIDSDDHIKNWDKRQLNINDEIKSVKGKKNSKRDYMKNYMQKKREQEISQEISDDVNQELVNKSLTESNTGLTGSNKSLTESNNVNPVNHLLDVVNPVLDVLLDQDIDKRKNKKEEKEKEKSAHAAKYVCGNSQNLPPADSFFSDCSEAEMKREPDRPPVFKGAGERLNSNLSIEDEFTTIWEVYPRHESHDAAYVEYMRAVTAKPRGMPPVSELIKIIQQWLPVWKARDIKFVPTLSKWLSSRRWTDELPPSSEPPEVSIVLNEFDAKTAWAEANGYTRADIFCVDFLNAYHEATMALAGVVE